MKFVFLAGGTAGLVVAAGTDYFSGRGPTRMLFDGAVGCLAGALLFRWFWTVVLRGIREVVLARQREAIAAQAAAAAAATPAPAPAVPSTAPKSRI